MAESMRFTSTDGTVIEFGEASQYRCYVPTEVTGIASVKNTVYQDQVYGKPGGIKRGNHVEARDISISGHLMEKYAEGWIPLRKALLHAVANGCEGTLEYLWGTTVKHVWVQVEKANVTYKESDVYPRFVVDFVALDPYWASAEQGTKISGTEKLFRLPIQFASSGMAVERFIKDIPVVNDGDIPVDFYARMTMLAPIATLPDFQIIHIASGGFIDSPSLVINADIGDYLEISTRYANKYMQLFRTDGTVEDFSNSLIQSDTIYPQLLVGSNLFTFYMGTQIQHLVDLVIYHTDLSQGV